MSPQKDKFIYSCYFFLQYIYIFILRQGYPVLGSKIAPLLTQFTLRLIKIPERRPSIIGKMTAHFNATPTK